MCVEGRGGGYSGDIEYKEFLGAIEEYNFRTLVDRKAGRGDQDALAALQKRSVVHRQRSQDSGAHGSNDDDVGRWREGFGPDDDSFGRWREGISRQRDGVGWWQREQGRG